MVVFDPACMKAVVRAASDASVISMMPGRITINVPKKPTKQAAQLYIRVLLKDNHGQQIVKSGIVYCRA